MTSQGKALRWQAFPAFPLALSSEDRDVRN
jgi:hypothetical protein